MKILYFPYIVIDELMKQFEPVDLINLSFCSKTTHSFVKTYAKIKDDLEIESFRFYGYSVQFREKKLIGVVLKERMNPENQIYTNNDFLMGWIGKHGHLCVSQDVVQACREATNYICDLFNIPVSTVTVDNDQDTWMLDFAQQRQEQKLKEVFVHADVVSAEHYSRILQCNATETLLCRVCPPRDYRFDGKLPSVTYLDIYSGHWITRELLLGLDAPYACLERTELRSADMNAVLRFWLDGGLPNLKCLEICGLALASVEEIDKSIRDRFERAQGEITYKRDHLELGVEFNSDAYHLRREDNAVATVRISYNQFVMAVWPDAIGNRV